MRCPDKTCPGHAGIYKTMEVLDRSTPVENCHNCWKMWIEDGAGRAQVRKVMAKFISVDALNCRNEKELYPFITCSITGVMTISKKDHDNYKIRVKSLYNT